MANTQALYGQTQQKTKQTNSHSQARATQKKDLILKNKNLQLNLRDTYLEVSDGVLTQIYGVLNLKALYIHKEIELSISRCYAISKYLQIYFIDGFGNIVARYKRSKKL